MFYNNDHNSNNVQILIDDQFINIYLFGKSGHLILSAQINVFNKTTSNITLKIKFHNKSDRRHFIKYTFGTLRKNRKKVKHYESLLNQS